MPDSQTIIAYVVGYAYAIILGRIFAGLIVNMMSDRKPERKEYHGPATGYFESVLVVTAWILNVKEAIGIWLAFKVAGRWAGLVRREKVSLPIVEKRGEWLHIGSMETEQTSSPEGYVAFIIGTGVSIMYGVVGALIVEWIENCEIGSAIMVGIAFPLGSLVYWLWLRYRTG